MAARLVICPVVTVGGVRYPKVATIDDPGRQVPIREPAAKLVYAAIISDGIGAPEQVDNFCLALVGGIDMSELDADGEITVLFETEDRPLASIRAFLTSTPTGLGWSAARQQRLRDRLVARGVDVTGLTGDDPLWRIANRVASRITGRPEDVRGLRTTRMGA